MHARIEQHVAVQLRQQRRGADDRRLDFDDVQALHFRIGGQRGSGHAAAKSDQEHAARGMRQRAEMTHQELRGLVLIRGVHFSVGSQGNIVVGSCHGNRGIQTIGEIHDVHQVRVFPHGQRPVIQIPIHDGVVRRHGGIVKII